MRAGGGGRSWLRIDRYAPGWVNVKLCCVSLFEQGDYFFANCGSEFGVDSALSEGVYAIVFGFVFIVGGWAALGGVSFSKRESGLEKRLSICSSLTLPKSESSDE